MIFFYHYNKPSSLKFKSPKLSLHFNKTCHIIDKIICHVPTYSHNQKRQPRVIIKGNAKEIKIVDNVAEIH